MPHEKMSPPRSLLKILAKADRTKIDPEFLPYLDKINQLGHVVSDQCCIGHCSYPQGIPKAELPPKATKRWGYLSLNMTLASGSRIHEGGLLDRWEKDWLWVVGSQLFLKRAQEPQLLSGVPGWGRIAFAWDAKHWPKPAEDITEALERLAV